MDRVPNIFKSERGATATEYALMLALILAVAFATIVLLGFRVEQGFNLFVSLFENALN